MRSLNAHLDYPSYMKSLGSSWSHALDLPLPTRIGQNHASEVIVTSLSWLKSRDQLVCSYLHDGVM